MSYNGWETETLRSRAVRSWPYISRPRFHSIFLKQRKSPYLTWGGGQLPEYTYCPGSHLRDEDVQEDEERGDGSSGRGECRQVYSCDWNQRSKTPPVTLPVLSGWKWTPTRRWGPRAGSWGSKELNLYALLLSILFARKPSEPWHHSNWILESRYSDFQVFLSY